MAATSATTIDRATSWARRLTHMKRRRRELGFGALRLRPQLEEPQQGGEAVPVLDVAFPDDLRQLRDRNPLDPVGFARIRWFANVLGAIGQEDVKPLVDQADGRKVGKEQGERAGPPAGFLQRLPPGCLDRVLARLDPSRRDLPTGRVGDE